MTARRFLYRLPLLLLALVCLALAMRHEASAQRQAPTWIGPPPPVGANTPTSTLLPPNVLASWTVSQWYRDRANATGCASDSNATCTVSNCATAGDGPCKTYTQIATRWGGYAPRLRQGTTITNLSADPDDTDPVRFFGAVEHTGSLLVNCSLGASQQTGTGTISAVVAKNRATPQLLKATLPAGCAAGNLIKNTTHTSNAWVNALVTGSTFTISQPLAPVSLPSTDQPPEVNTWTSGDTVTCYAPLGVYIDAIRPTVDNNATGLVSVQSCQFLSFESGGTDYVDLSSIVGVYESSAPSALLEWNGGVYAQSNIVNDNVIVTFAGESSLIGAYVSAGIVGNSGLPGFGPGTFLVHDVILPQGANVATTNFSLPQGGIGFAYVAADAGLVGFGGGSICINNTCGQSEGSIVWGPGYVNAGGDTRVIYPSGSAQAAATFVNTGGLQANGFVVGCVTKVGAAPTSCNTSITASNLDSNLGTDAGCIGQPQGGAYCNGGF